LPSEEQVVTAFFDKYVVYPLNNASRPGFLEHLPALFLEVNVDSRNALRWAVQAAALADASQDHRQESQLAAQALHCYGEALKYLNQSLSEKGKIPDDSDLMTVVVLDIFEVSRASLFILASLVSNAFLQTLFLPGASRGEHAQGMAHILRLRGHDQFHSPRGWGLFQIAHHRMVKLR
jgi:hypothetical protein